MILKFFKHGDGQGDNTGRGAIRYVYQEDKAAGGKRYAPPETVKGDPKITQRLIEACPHEWKYKSGMISFTREEYTEEVAKKVLKSFEETAFAGLLPHQYDILIVKHEEDKDIHFHFIIPRYELTTGKSFNICRPRDVHGRWKNWSKLQREINNLVEPETHPMEKSILSSKEKQLLRHGANLPVSKFKQDLEQLIWTNIGNGLITKRSELLTFLKASGLKVIDVEANQFSIYMGEGKRNLRLRGEIYGDKTDITPIRYQDITRDSKLSRHHESKTIKGEQSNRSQHTRNNNRLQKGLEAQHREAIERHENYVRHRYGRQLENNNGKDTGLLRELQERRSARNEAIQLAQRRTDSGQRTNQSHSSNKSLVKTGNTQDARIQMITQLLASTADPVKRAELQVQLASLTDSKADSFIDTLTNRGPALRI